MSKGSRNSTMKRYGLRVSSCMIPWLMFIEVGDGSKVVAIERGGRVNVYVSNLFYCIWWES